MSDPMKLTPADHVLIHACGTLLTDPYEGAGRDVDDEMVRQILNDVLYDVNADHPALQRFVEVGRELAHAQTPRAISQLRSTRVGLIRDFHRGKLANAFDLIKERYRS